MTEYPTPPVMVVPDTTIHAVRRALAHDRIAQSATTHDLSRRTVVGGRIKSGHDGREWA